MAAPIRLNVDHGVDERADDLGELYHEESKYAPHTLPRLLAAYRRYEDWAAAQPLPLAAEKRYPAAPLVALPRPRRLWWPLAWALRERRSQRSGGTLALRDLATLLHAAGGRRADGGRFAPSAGALHPLEWYVAARRVDGLAPGIFHYAPGAHALERIGEGAPDAWLLDAEAYREAPAMVVLTAIMPRLAVKYGERGYRFALLEAGHAAQNLLLAAASRRLAAAPVGGYYDDRVHATLGLDGVEEIALYVLPVGRRLTGSR